MLVPSEGFEPSRPYGLEILSLVRSASFATRAYKMIFSQWTLTIGNKGRVSCMHPLSYERFELVITKSITALCLVTSYSNTFKNYHHPQEIRTPHTLPGLHYPYAIVGLNSAISQFTIVQMVSQVNHYHFHCRYTWVLPCLLSLYIVAYLNMDLYSLLKILITLLQLHTYRTVY